MDKFWERYIQSRPAPGESKGAFDAFAAASRSPEPRTMAQGGRIGFSRAGLASAPWFRGTSYPGTLKAPRGKEMLEWLPETGALAASATLALRDREEDDLTHKSVPVDTGEGVYIGDRGEKEKERQRIRFLNETFCRYASSTYEKL